MFIAPSYTYVIGRPISPDSHASLWLFPHFQKIVQKHMKKRRLTL